MTLCGVFYIQDGRKAWFVLQDDVIQDKSEGAKQHQDRQDKSTNAVEMRLEIHFCSLFGILAHEVSYLLIE